MLATRRFSRPAAALAAIAILSAACKSGPTPIVSTSTPTDIVRQNATDAFETFLPKADAPALQDFRSRISTAHSRQDLLNAWANVPVLLAKGQDFLTKHVFQKALDEEKWPPSRPPSDFEDAFVAGVQQAVDAYLKQVQ